MVIIRPFESTEAEYEAVVSVINAAWPDEPNSVENMKFWDDNRNMKYLMQRFVMEDRHQRIVAEGACWESAWSYVPGKYGWGFNVLPELENQGLEEQFYDHTLAFLAERDPKPIMYDSFTREDKSDRIKFFTERGYKLIQRDNSSGLDLQDYDYTPFEGATEKVLAAGFELLTLPELQARDPDWMQQTYAMENVIARDIPMPDEFTPQPIEEYAKEFKSPNFLPDGYFVALENGQCVGLSNLWKDAVRKDRLWVGLTGVLPSHRRRGIATALKLLTFEYAQAHDVRFIETENEENNPMYELNVKLGFKSKPAWVTYRLEKRE